MSTEVSASAAAELRERPAVDAPGTGRLCERDHRLLRSPVVPEDEHVTIDRTVPAQLLRADIVEGGRDLDPVAEDATCNLRARSFRGKLHDRHLWRHERHRGVDHDLARKRVTDFGQDCVVVGIGHRDNDYVAGFRRTQIVVAPHARTDLGRGGIGLLATARA